MTNENTISGISVACIYFLFTARANQFCCSPEAAAEKSLSLFKVSAMSSTFSFLSTSTVALFFRQ